MQYQKQLILASLLLGIGLTGGCTKQEVSYSKDVRPILEEHCIECHTPGGEGYVKSGLGMSDYDALMKGTKFGSVINPGSSIDSTLVILLERKAHLSINMPRGLPALPPKQLDTIKRWIDQGAKNN